MKKLITFLAVLILAINFAFAANYSLQWTASTNTVSGYNLYQASGVGSTNFVKIATGITTTNYTLPTLPVGTVYAWYCTAYYISVTNNTVLESVPSNIAVLDLSLPSPPTGLTIIAK